MLPTAFWKNTRDVFLLPDLLRDVPEVELSGRGIFFAAREVAKVPQIEIHLCVKQQQQQTVARLLLT